MEQLSLEVAWPPEYQLKRHKRARYVRLRTTKKGLQITVPLRFSLKEIPAILEENKTWVLKQLIAFTLKAITPLPSTIFFNSINQTWQVNYIKSKNKLRIIERPHQEIIVSGDIEDKDACKEKLIIWIKHHAKHFLIDFLNQTSAAIQLPYNKVVVRDQLTRWGSCTTHKKINLNYKLIFLPLNLMQHILIHELCHTKFLNHSVKFWNLVAKHDKEWEKNNSAMKKADQYIPSWI